MQYSTLFLAALVSTTAALPSSHRAHHHHHHRRAAEPAPEAAADYDLSNVNWKTALSNVDWGKIFPGSNAAAGNAGNVANTPAAISLTTTVAVVAPAGTQSRPALTTTQQQTVAKPTTSAPSTPAPAAGGVGMTAGAGEYNIQVVNNCPYTIWQAGWQTNTAGGLIAAGVKGNQMNAGSTNNLAIPKSALGVQIWARTGCTGSGSSFHCDVGDCQGFLCTSMIWQKGPIMAEFGSGLNTDMYNTGITAYDISAIPGNNVGCKIQPTKSSCETKYCPVSGCDNSQAWHFDSDMNLGSPADTTCSNDTNFVVTFCP